MIERVQSMKRLLAYDGWANSESLAALRSAGEAVAGPVKHIAHIIGSEYAWLARLKREPQAVPIWPEWSLDECEARAPEVASLWDGYLDSLSAESLAEPVEYTNSKGEAWKSSVEDIFMHVVMHSAYHRGQIAAGMRAAGATPAYTDFIHSVRSGFLD